MVFWLSFFEVVNPWVPYSFRNYKKRCVPFEIKILNQDIIGNLF